MSKQRSGSVIACTLGRHLRQKNVAGTEEPLMTNGACKDEPHSYISLVK